jgi:hypothetical protein
MKLNSLARVAERVIIRAWKPKLNYDEAKVAAFSLPDPLLRADGWGRHDVASWIGGGRSEILRLFESDIYGFSPRENGSSARSMIVREASIFAKKAIVKDIDIRFRNRSPKHVIRVLLLIPRNAHKPVPVFLGLNFFGNYTVTPETALEIQGQWHASSRYSRPHLVFRPASTRGADRSRWPLDMLLGRGYAVATAYYGDFEPDFPGGWRYGVRSMFPSRSPIDHGRDPNAVTTFKKRSAEYAGPPWSSPDEWGAIAAWSWGTSRMLDCLADEPDLDLSKVVLIGHSRLGKAALWAGAQDERFAIVIANNSGCGGAALSRRRFGETLKLLNRVRPHWFCQNLKKYDDREQDLPVDQHMLIGLIAPRPVYIASAADDLAADPRGEYLSAREAARVYALFGLKGLPGDAMPALGAPIGETIGYHIRAGGHGLTTDDWTQFVRFTDRHFGRSDTP